MENNIDPWSVALKYGLYVGVALIFHFLIVDMMGETSNTALNYLQYLYLAVGIFFCHKEYKEHQEEMNYGRGFGIGMRLTLIAGSISAIFSLIYITLINTEYIAQLIEHQRIMMEEQGVDDEVIEVALGFTETLQGNPFLFFGAALIGTLFMGLVVSLLISIITKKTI
ncbi:MAG: DUF4199 domain-containing protein [Cyclobacteriaceae bacterium]|nr:DUF4199 domain-containing protein [Cyclobacteriaceae bacterium]MCH8516726.1 DUF4199 domain-containing protein [Cyclobacteriaceae bacterium]